MPGRRRRGCPVGSCEDRANRFGDAGLWATLGCAFLLNALDSFAGSRLLLVCLLPLAYWAFVHFAERRRCYELRGGLGAFALGAVGVAWGAALAFIPPASLALGSETLWLTARTAALFLLWLGEELIWRGLLLRVLEPRIGSALALAATSIAFAAWHLTGDPFFLVELTAAGTMAGAAYLYTRRLWMSVGLHVGWNLVVVYTPDSRSLLSYLAVLLLQLLTTVTLLLLARRRARLVRAPWLKGAWRKAGMTATPAQPMSQTVST